MIICQMNCYSVYGENAFHAYGQPLLDYLADHIWSTKPPLDPWMQSQEYDLNNICKINISVTIALTQIKLN